MGALRFRSKALTLFAPDDCTPEVAHPNNTIGTPKLRPVTHRRHHSNRARVPPGPTLGETPDALPHPLHPLHPQPQPNAKLHPRYTWLAPGLIQG